MSDHRRYMEQTAAHYTKQWGKDLNFGEFVKANPKAAQVMPARQLPWQELFEQIRQEASQRTVSVYDAACGYGDVMNALTANPNPAGLRYLGIDLHHALADIERPDNAIFLRGDITEPSGKGPFDFIVCRAAIHHTPDPATTYRTLIDQLAPGGTIAITAYARKAPMREGCDDELRKAIVPMSNDEAFAVSNQITKLGHDLQSSAGTITIAEDLPFLGIKAGSYKIQDFIYRHFMKCWYNPNFTEAHCDLVNFDWYHPPFAHRYELEELMGWAAASGLTVNRTASTEAQHYVEAAKV